MHKGDEMRSAKTAISFGAAVLGLYVGLIVPDFDQKLLSILHHRSIISHSVLLPILLKPWLPVPVFAGLAAGMSIHLLADSISPSVGFAQIYLPS